jgi:glycosyltransferase involved in cell wall biosynthesis
MMPTVSIIVRTKNEERWIAHCLEMLFAQEYQDFEVILVDNESDDHTVQVARRYPLSSIVNIKNFRPGLALNEGIRASSGKYVVCLSAHCVPVDKSWLSNLVRNFETDDIAGAYGRQIPVSFTDDIDKRDLLIVFGQDRRVQEKDCFFHNANSIIRRDVWDKHQFDEEVTNIEDRVWAKQILQEGYKIIYDPEATVYHHHGLHQGNKKDRAKGVVSIIEEVEREHVNRIPDSLKPENANIVALLPVGDNLEEGSLEYILLARLVSTLKEVSFLNNIYLISPNSELATQLGVEFINRDSNMNSVNVSLEKLLQVSLEQVESKGDYPEAILYANYDYPFHSKDLFEELIVDAQYKGYDTVFPGFADYGHLWLHDENQGFVQIDPSMTSREEREPAFRALYGLGCLTSASFIRKGKLVDGRIGILPVKDFKQTLRTREHGGVEIIEAMLQLSGDKL